MVVVVWCAWHDHIQCHWSHH